MKNFNAERRLHPSHCPQCKQPARNIGRRRMNTAYQNDNSNFIICCRQCFDEAEEYWAERWADYYSGIL